MATYRMVNATKEINTNSVIACPQVYPRALRDLRFKLIIFISCPPLKETNRIALIDQHWRRQRAVVRRTPAAFRSAAVVTRDDAGVDSGGSAAILLEPQLCETFYWHAAA